MTDSEDKKLDDYYRHIQSVGNVRTLDHAKRWSDGVLKTLGTSLHRKVKKDLAKSLPSELAQSLNGVFWLLHFHDPTLSSHEFLRRAGRRSGNSNFEFARYPTLAVFGGLKIFAADNDLEKEIAEDLSPDIRNLWEQAQPAGKSD
jgi:uncharacterized protein (DUF2267 family)